MTQTPTPSPDPSAPYGGPSQQPVPPATAQARQVRVALPAAVPYVTYTIVGITVFVYLLQYISSHNPSIGYANPVSQLDWLEYYGACIKEGIRAGELWRLITPVLLHASVPHILFNMYALVVFGAGLERNFGHWRYLVLYLLGGFAGNSLSFLFLPLHSYSVGASTAIFGLIGAEGIFLYQNRQLFGNGFRRAIGNVIFIVVVNLALGLTPGIDNWGHVGGLLGGLIFAWFAGPKWEVQGMMPALHLADKREFREVISGAAVVLLIFSAVAAWGMIAH